MGVPVAQVVARTIAPPSFNGLASTTRMPGGHSMVREAVVSYGEASRVGHWRGVKTLYWVPLLLTERYPPSSRKKEVLAAQPVVTSEAMTLFWAISTRFTAVPPVATDSRLPAPLKASDTGLPARVMIRSS